jgi:hypothetical protein
MADRGALRAARLCGSRNRFPPLFRWFCARSDLNRSLTCIMASARGVISNSAERAGQRPARRLVASVQGGEMYGALAARR